MLSEVLEPELEQASPDDHKIQRQARRLDKSLATLQKQCGAMEGEFAREQAKRD
ncbi:MAG: hypothetical protein ACE14L_04515 [Terriglobales bacterium]